MQILVIGSGGRENALAWKLSQSPQVTKVYWTGKASIVGEAEKMEGLSIPADSYSELVQFAQDQQVALTVVGPDQALADGVVDLFERKGLKIYGPTRQAAQIETSKSFAKEIMQAVGIPTAAYREFTDVEQAKIYLEKAANCRHVVKKDGLALEKE